MLQLKRLRAAIKKVRFLLSFNVTKWLVRSGSGGRPRLSFGGPQGLLDFVSNADTDSTFYHDALGMSTMSPDGSTGLPSWSSTPTSPPSVPEIRRLSSTSSRLLLRTESTATTSDEEEAGDINHRAQDFIDNFRTRLRREISLDLAYARTNSIESNTSSEY